MIVEPLVGDMVLFRVLKTVLPPVPLGHDMPQKYYHRPLGIGGTAGFSSSSSSSASSSSACLEK